MKLLKPVDPTYITQKYGAKSSMYATYHKGIDIRLKNTDYKVKAVNDGTVIYVSQGIPWYTNGKKNSNYNKGNPFGTHVKIKHRLDNKDVYSLYCHLESYSVSVGQKVKGGEVIGRGGSTGLSTADHLHLEIRVGLDASNKTIDPAPYLVDSLQTEEELKAIEEAQKVYDEKGAIARKAVDDFGKAQAALALLKGRPVQKFIIVTE